MSDASVPVNDSVLVDCHIGKRVVFIHSDFPDDKNRSFSFSSELEKIGIENDCFIKNHTEVMIISDVIIIASSKYGLMHLLKVLAPAATMWINCQHLHLLGDK